MTEDAELIEKVRTAAEALNRTTTNLLRPSGRSEAAAAADVCARATLALVEQYEALLQAQSDADRRATVKYAMGTEEDRIIGHQWRGEACGYGLTASRILSALRTAVGE